jgi:hypothetical protein
MKLEIQSQEHTDIEISDCGYIRIKQADPCGEDAVVMFAIHNVDMICRMLKAAKKGAIENRSIYLKSKGKK